MTLSPFFSLCPQSLSFLFLSPEFFLLSLPAEREEARERLPTAPTQLKMKGFAYKKITRFALQIFLLNVKFPSFSKRCSDDVGFTIQFQPLGWILFFFIWLYNFFFIILPLLFPNSAVTHSESYMYQSPGHKAVTVVVGYICYFF